MVAHVLQLAERRDVNTPIIVMQAVSMQLRKFYEERQGMNTGEPTLYAAVLYLLANLTLPMQGQPPQMQVPPHMMGPNIPTNIPANMPGNMPTNMPANIPGNMPGQFMQPQQQQIPPQMNPMDQQHNPMQPNQMMNQMGN
jgi:hypothetical protein